MTIFIMVFFVAMCISIIFLLGCAHGDNSELPPIGWLTVAIMGLFIFLSMYAIYHQGFDAAKLAGSV